jgi:polyphosphate kinase
MKHPKNLPVPYGRLINRELSWLAFNERVLAEASNKRNPVLERAHFLSISATNLDEFMMVRVAGLMDNIRMGSPLRSDDGLTAQEQLSQIAVRIRTIVDQQQKTWKKLRAELAENGLNIVSRDALSSADIKWLETYFSENIFPILTPIAVDPAHPFPFLPNLGIAQLFLFTRGTKKQEQITIIPFPQKQARFIALPPVSRRKASEQRFVLLEDVIDLNWSSLFPHSEKKDSTVIRIVRDSDLDIEEEAEDLVRHFERAVKSRRRGRVIRIKVASPTPPQMMQFILSQLHVESDDVISTQGMVGLSSLQEIYDCARPDLKFTPYNVRFPERITDYGGDCFAAIEAKDIVVHHPFESFDVVVQFLRQAARDKDVVSIKQTLYRTSDNSPIIQALIEAAEAGKSVTAVVELKARFDEEANIRWARDLERAGAQVVFGFVSLKTHTKVSLVTRRVDKKLRSYVHFGTGNYHPATARVYTDLSFFTSDPALCRDVAQLFNFLTGYTKPKALSKLILAPSDLRNSLIKLIHNEISIAKAGGKGAVWAKMNALVDPRIISALYDASNEGVKIELIVRGVCCLRPGVAGMSENIRVRSIIGRFLEHSRIFCFGGGHGLPSPNAKVYISSADWMPRNFDWRVEGMMLIENSTVHMQIMNQIMVANLKDERNAWLLGSDGNYTHVPVTDKSFSSHDYFMVNPSLSGRGKALKKAKTAFKDIYKLRKKG